MEKEKKQQPMVEKISHRKHNTEDIDLIEKTGVNSGALEG